MNGQFLYIIENHFDSFDHYVYLVQTSIQLSFRTMNDNFMKNATYQDLQKMIEKQKHLNNQRASTLFINQNHLNLHKLHIQF
jgi:hypothetical protein